MAVCVILNVLWWQGECVSIRVCSAVGVVLSVSEGGCFSECVDVEG